MLGSPDTDVVFQIGSHGLEGHAHLSWPLLIAPFHAAHLHLHPQVLLLSPCPAQLLVPCKPCAEGKVHPLSVIGQTIKELLGQGKALRDIPHPWPPPGHGATDQNPWLHPSGQLLVPCMAYPPKPGLCTVGLGGSCGTVSKASQGFCFAHYSKTV